MENYENNTLARNSREKKMYGGSTILGMRMVIHKKENK